MCPPSKKRNLARERVVSRYNVVRSRLIDNVTTPLQVGNGNFAFNVDNTGMQTFLPFNTLSSWAWHNDSLPTNGIEKLSDYHGVAMVTHGRNVSYDIPDPVLPKISQWIISNPNRINLGRIGLKYKNSTLAAGQITDPKQTLDLWNGVILSTFKIRGEVVKVVTTGDFNSDAVTFQIDSPLVATGDLQVEFDFPYPPIHTTTYKYEIFAGVYDFPLNHTTTIINSRDENAVHVYHELQKTNYWLNLRWPSKTPLKLSRNEPQGSNTITAHRFTLSSTSAFRQSPSMITFTAHFSPDKQSPALPSTIQRRNTVGWNQYWGKGGFIDLTLSSNPKADELQRRIILSQYHVRVNSAAKGQSPQESGLMNNGWYGKFHMEMVIWHNAHWSTWGRQEHFDNIFPELYETFLPKSLARAKTMGWEGARWPKMTELGTGVSSPGSINSLLMWQQPHPMYLAQLAYQSSPTWKTLERWDLILTATANYMASYAWKNATSGNYDLGPPKLGQAIPTEWTTIAENLAPLPQVDGLYTVYEGLNSSWWSEPSLNGDPRSLIMLQGILPDTPAVDPAVALKTADKVAEVWTDPKIRGWGRPVLAINSARIGKPDRAIYHLTAFDYWKFDDAGFAVRGGDGGTPPPFMPGNAGFLYAVAYMAAGWQGSGDDSPGFPKDGSWVVKQEGLRKAP
ncbi:Six-hairpin glycosidase-like protein [Bisporella sp. PMI_857]|nr:Six-hairpin glycosidase-like protein [Bisporella sp. PMI_857]